MRVKGKRILKNGTIAGYVYNSKTKKWNWRFIGRQTGGDRTDERRQAREMERQARKMERQARKMERQARKMETRKAKQNEIIKKTREKSIKRQLLLNEPSRNTDFNSRSPYQKERNVLLNYLNDKVRRTAFFRPKRRKKFRNISNRIRNSDEKNKINGVNVLEKAYENIKVILEKGTRNNPQRFKNLTKKVEEYRKQRKQNKINYNRQVKEVMNKVQSGLNF